MGKFLKQMTANSDATLRTRASLIDTQARVEVENIIAKLTSEESQLRMRLADLTDFAPESTQSLRPGVANWDPKRWAQEMVNVNVALYENSVQMQIVKAIQAEYFGDEVAEVVTAEE